MLSSRKGDFMKPKYFFAVLMAALSFEAQASKAVVAKTSMPLEAYEAQAPEDAAKGILRLLDIRSRELCGSDATRISEVRLSHIIVGDERLCRRWPDLCETYVNAEADYACLGAALADSNTDRICRRWPELCQ
jgi:hypothetical protein